MKPMNSDLTNRNSEISPITWAKVAGVAYLIMMIVAIFAEFFVRQSIIELGDATTTANNIVDSEELFRMAIVGYLIILTLDVVLALALYIVLKPVEKNLALLAAFFRLTYAAINGINQVFYFLALELLTDSDYLTVFEPDQLHALVLLFLTASTYGYVIGLTFFGCHLLILGYLVFKSGYIPRILGIGVIVAGLGYLIDNYTQTLLPDYAEMITLVLLLPVAVGEIAFGLWLLVKGTKIPEMES